MSVNSISSVVPFRGSGSESTGSPAYLTNSVALSAQEPDTVEISGKNNPQFQAQAAAYDGKTKKGMSGLGVITLTALGAAALITGLGFAGRAMHNNKIANETIKKFLDKKYPKIAIDKCYEWCGAVKGYGVKGKTWATDKAWPTIKGWFSKNK